MPQLAHTPQQLKQFAEHALLLAKQRGADEAVVEVSDGYGMAVEVRLDELDRVENNLDKSLSISVYLNSTKGKKMGNASTSDLSEKALVRTVQAALDIARYTEEDDCTGLPNPNELAMPENKDYVAPDHLKLAFAWDIDSERAITLAQQAERAALDTLKSAKNPGQTGKSQKLSINSDGANVWTSHNHFWLANSHGFSNGYGHTRHGLYVTPIVGSGDDMHRDHWSTDTRCADDLQDAQALGRIAATRTLSRLGAKQISTRTCPVLFEAPVAIGLLGSLVQGLSGGNLYRKTSFLQDSLGTPVLADHIDVLEDPHVVKGQGSAPFDNEGVCTRARTVVSAGVVEGYFLSSYTARKLKMTNTGNSGGSHNLYMVSRRTQAGDDLTAMLKALGTGLFVTSLMGQGVNMLTGDYSRGAFGYWVENGVIIHPVNEITIAGNMRQMLRDIVAIGADVDRRGSKHVGSVLIRKMTIAGA